MAQEKQDWRVVPMPIHGWAIQDSEGNALIKDIYAEGLATRIVRAVNSHEALVIACRNALQSRTALLGECGHEPLVDSCTTCGLRSALALAEKDS